MKDQLDDEIKLAGLESFCTRGIGETSLSQLESRCTPGNRDVRGGEVRFENS